MFNAFFLFFLFLTLSLNAVFASEKDFGNLTEITLENGLNNEQSREVAKALKDDLEMIFNAWLTDTHFIYYPRCSNNENKDCRQNLNFNVNFSAASVDLDNDNVNDLLVRVEHENVCGAGACPRIDILLGGDIIGIKAGILSGSKYYVSDKTKYGLRYLFFEAECRSDIDNYDICNFYMLEPTSSEKYSQAILVEKGREVE